MRKFKLPALGLGLALYIGTLAYAQTVTNQAPGPTDAVLVQAGGPGGTGYPTTIQALRHAFAHTLVATGTTVNTAMTNGSAQVIVQGAITTLTVTLPPSPFVGEIAGIACPGGSVTALTITPATVPTGQVMVGTNPTSCTSGGAAANNSTWTYDSGVNTWYRIE